MEIHRPDDADGFLELAGPLVERDEARNQLLLGIAGTIAEHPDAYDTVRFWVAVDGERPVAAAVRTAPHNLVLADPEPGTDLEPLLGAVLADDPGVPGLVGNAPEADAAASFLARASTRSTERTLAQGVFALSWVEEVPRAPGAHRRADETDRTLLLDWLTAFEEEALPFYHVSDRADHERTLDRRFSSERSGLWLWEDAGVPVSLAGFSGPTPNGIRIGPVYTPPSHRRRGYATTLVADLSQWLLGQGYRSCFLYTDLSNPTSNHIYETIGYRQVAEAVEIRFAERP
jgi:predicted GNAT family acetyltransferase